MEKRRIGPIECRDTALAMIFLLLLIWLFSGRVWFAYAAMAFTLYAMILPKTLAPLARGWFGLSYYLGLVMSKLLLSLVYVIIVLPVALARKAMGKDSMRLKAWHAGTGSAFVVREHRYTRDDLSNMF